MAGNVIDNAVNTLASPPAPIDQMALAGSAAPHDLSMFALFMQADTIVKLVLFLLLAASFWSWAVIFDKTSKLRRLHRDAEEFEESFWSGGSLDDLYERVGERPEDPMSAVFAAAMREWRRSVAKGLIESTSMRANLKERVERVMQITLGREMDRLDRSIRRPIRHGVGHHEQLPGDRRGKEHEPSGCSARHRRIAVCDRSRPG